MRAHADVQRREVAAELQMPVHDLRGREPR